MSVTRTGHEDSLEATVMIRHSCSIHSVRSKELPMNMYSQNAFAILLICT